MNNIKHLCIITVVCITLSLFFTTVTSALNTGVSTVELSDEQITTFTENVNITMLDEDICQNSSGALGFDVNSNGDLAIGCKLGDLSYVCIHDANNSFLYAYSFNTNGSFAFEWDENNLVIYFIRSGVVLSVDNNGKIVEINKIEDTVENSIYINSSVKALKKEVNSITYSMKNNKIFSPSFSRIVATDNSGRETILFDKSTDHTILFILYFGIALTFILIVILTIYKKVKVKEGTQGTIPQPDEKD